MIGPVDRIGLQPNWFVGRRLQVATVDGQRCLSHAYE